MGASILLILILWLIILTVTSFVTLARFYPLKCNQDWGSGRTANRLYDCSYLLRTTALNGDARERASKDSLALGGTTTFHVLFAEKDRATGIHTWSACNTLLHVELSAVPSISETRKNATMETTLQTPNLSADYRHTRAKQQKRPQQPGDIGGVSAPLDSQAQPNMAYQHKHALHRLRRLKKRSPHRDLVISFVPRLRISIMNRLDFFHRYSKQEQEVLSCFDFLDELLLTYCDETSESPICCQQKLYQIMIRELIQS